MPRNIGYFPNFKRKGFISFICYGRIFLEMDLVCILNSSVNIESVLYFENFLVNQKFFHIDSYADTKFPKKPNSQLPSQNFIQNFLTPFRFLSLVNGNFTSVG
jgi:hypothetical protein